MNTPSTQRRILAFKENPDGTISKFYTLRRTRGPENHGQNPLGCTAEYSMQEFCPPSGRIHSGSDPPQERRGPSATSTPYCARPPLQTRNRNSQSSPLNESELEEGAWGPKPNQCPYRQEPSPRSTAAVNRMLTACQNVRGIPLPPHRSSYSRRSSSPEQSETENDCGCQSSSGPSPLKIPSYGPSPCGDPIAPICMNRATGAIPKNPFRKRSPGPPTPSIPPSPVNIIFMTPYQLTESRLMEEQKQCVRKLPIAPASSAAVSCPMQAAPAPQNDLNFKCNEITPRRGIACCRRRLNFDSCEDRRPSLPDESPVRSACPAPASKSSKSCSAKQIKSCLKPKKESACPSSDEECPSNYEECPSNDEECNLGDADGDRDEAPPKEPMRKLTVITRKDACGREVVNEIIEEDFFPENCDGGERVKNVVKGVDPNNYLERRIAQFENYKAECEKQEKVDKKRSKCCPCVEAARASEGSEDQTLIEIINTTLKSFQLIANVVMKRPPVKCLSNLPADTDALNKLLEESINRTESNMSLIRKGMADALAELSSIFARRAKEHVPEIEELIKHFEKRMCPEDDGEKAPEKPGQEENKSEIESAASGSDEWHLARSS